MKKILITLCPFILGLLVAWFIDFPHGNVNLQQSPYTLFVSNLIMCLIILYAHPRIADIVYIFNLFFLGIVIYIMLFIVHHPGYYHAPIELATLVYTYVYARDKHKLVQASVITLVIIMALVIENFIL